MSSRIITALKYVRQLGLHPLILYGLYRLGLRTGYYKGKTRINGIQLSNISSLFVLPDRESLSQMLGSEGRAALISEANEIIDGNVRVFGEYLPLNFNLNRALQHWTAYETDSGLLSSFLILHGDIKYLWEPARFGWAFTLGRAYHLTQDEKYAGSFWKYFDHFTEANPVNTGPNWMNGQEVAIRMLALVWALHIFTNLSADQRTRLAESIAQHAARVAQTILYARSQNNNHLITEAAAIYTAGLLFKEFKWRALGWRWLNWSFQNQVGDYGEYIQHSTNYHRLMLQTALFVNFIKQDGWPRASAQALGRATHWLFSLLDSASGSTPNLGANDGALIFPLSSSAFGDYRPTVQAAARAFLNTQIESGFWDEMALWFGLPLTKNTYTSKDYLSDNLHGRESWAYFRASTFKSRLSHSDQLHLDLWWRGLNITQDAGTYLYNAKSPWDNPLVTTRVHNTVTVDGQDQMTRAGRFLMLDWVNGFQKPEIIPDENIQRRAKAYHTGYANIKHQRSVTITTDEKWVVEDDLITSKFVLHTYRLHWLLPDWEWKIEQRDSAFDLLLTSPHGLVRLSVSSSQPTENRVSLIRAGALLFGDGEPKPFDGWISKVYGEKSPALSFATQVTGDHSISFNTEFTFPK